MANEIPSDVISQNHSPDEGLVYLKDIQRQIDGLRETFGVNSPQDCILKQAATHVRHQCTELEVKRDAMQGLIREVNIALSKIPK